MRHNLGMPQYESFRCCARPDDQRLHMFTAASLREISLLNRGSVHFNGVSLDNSST